jgi:hypothetical protein
MLFDPKWETPKVEVLPHQQFLSDMADLIETNGWCQGNLKNRQGNFCIVGAHLELSWRRRAVSNQAFAALKRRLGDNISLWNDAPGRTKEEVIELIRRAAREG